MFDALGYAHELVNALIEHRPTAALVRNLSVELDNLTNYCLGLRAQEDFPFQDECSHLSEILREAHWIKVEPSFEDKARSRQMTLYADDYDDDDEEELQDQQ